MRKSDFEVLFERARLRARRNPRLFRLGVTLRAAFGVCFVLGLGLAALALLGWALAPLYDGAWLASPWHAARLVLAWPALIVLWTVPQVLKVRFPRPSGILLAREESPRLFELLDRMARRFRTPPIDAVRITGDLNAAILQRPRAGRPWRLGTTLIVGLPLAFSLSPRQFVAVLAHEFGHLRRQRVALGGWGCHVRALWHQVLENLETIPSRFAPVFGAIAQMETPVYCAESLVLSHLDELEADEAAAGVVGARRLGHALAEVALKHRFLAEDYWRKVYAQAARAPKPTILPYRHMAAAIRAGFDPDALDEWFESAVAEAPEDPLCTHPSLRVRVQALGLDRAEAGRRHDDAARRFFGAAIGRLTALLDRDWWHAERRAWNRRHREVTRALDRIAKLEAEGQRLAASDQLELALLVERYAGDRDPLNVYRNMVPQHQGRPDALLAMGRLLLARGDLTGVAYLRRALAEDDAIGLQATAMLIEHYEAYGLDAAARPYRKRMAFLLRQASLVQAALDAPVTSLRCLPPSLEMYELRALVRAVRSHAAVHAAYVVRRRCEMAPRWRAYVLAVVFATPVGEAEEECARAIESGIGLTGVWRVIAIERGGAEEQAVQEIRGAKIYSTRRSVARDGA